MEHRFALPSRTRKNPGLPCKKGPDLFEWCTKAIHIRTFFLCRSLSGLAERNGLRPFFVVEGNQYFIVIEVNSINEGVNQRLPLFLLGQV